MGYIRKTTLTENAVIRYPRFSVDNSPKKYYFSILQLFFHTDQLMNLNQKMAMNISIIEQVLKKLLPEIVVALRKILISEREREVLVNCGFEENAWSQICPDWSRKT